MWMIIGTQLTYVAFPVCCFWVMRYLTMPQKKWGWQWFQEKLCYQWYHGAFTAPWICSGTLHLLWWAQSVRIPVDNPGSSSTMRRYSEWHCHLLHHQYWNLPQITRPNKVAREELINSWPCRKNMCYISWNVCSTNLN